MNEEYCCCALLWRFSAMLRAASIAETLHAAGRNSPRRLAQVDFSPARAYRRRSVAPSSGRRRSANFRTLSRRSHRLEVCAMQGKQILITGATNGIGLAAAEALAALGANVAIVGRSETQNARCRGARSARRPRERRSPRSSPTCRRRPPCASWPPRCWPAIRGSMCSSTTPAPCTAHGS